VRAHTTSKPELDALRSVVERDLQDASLSGLSEDRRFATAYNAALQLAKMAAACAGYRVSGLGAHQTSFEAAELALGSSVSNLTAYFETCRRKRNALDYDMAHITPARKIRTLAHTSPTRQRGKSQGTLAGAF
jgi:hypothetical protein